MSTPTRTTHHHGDLRRALVQAGIEMLEARETFTLRAVARRVGVSPTAPYRHFSDKEHLEAAMAAEGFRSLQASLQETIARAGKDVQLLDLALTYTHYAIAHPALYDLMFGRPCGEDDERLAASTAVFDLIQHVGEETFPDASPYGLAAAGWALSHGLASLYLAGKLSTTTTEEFDALTAEALTAMTAITPK